MIQLYIHLDPLHDGWKQMQVHTKRSLTTIPTCGRQGSTTTNTKLTYNLFTPGPSVRLVENLARTSSRSFSCSRSPRWYWCITQLVLCWSKFLLVCSTRTFFAAVCRSLTITGKVLPALCHITCMPHSDCILRCVHVPLLNALELR